LGLNWFLFFDFLFTFDLTTGNNLLRCCLNFFSLLNNFLCLFLFLQLFVSLENFLFGLNLIGFGRLRNILLSLLLLLLLSLEVLCGLLLHLQLFPQFKPLINMEMFSLQHRIQRFTS
jgi:hypothetical protein